MNTPTTERCFPIWVVTKYDADDEVEWQWRFYKKEDAYKCIEHVELKGEEFCDIECKYYEYKEWRQLVDLIDQGIL